MPCSFRAAMCLSSVVFPLPFGPTRPYRRPARSESRASTKSSVAFARIENAGTSIPPPAPPIPLAAVAPAVDDSAENCAPIASGAAAAPPPPPPSAAPLACSYSFHRARRPRAS